MITQVLPPVLTLDFKQYFLEMDFYNYFMTRQLYITKIHLVTLQPWLVSWCCFDWQHANQWHCAELYFLHTADVPSLWVRTETVRVIEWPIQARCLIMGFFTCMKMVWHFNCSLNLENNQISWPILQT